MDKPDTVPLKEYLESILIEKEKPSLIANEGLLRRLESLNELRNEVPTDRSRFLSKDLYEQMHVSLLDRVSKIETAQSKLIGGFAVVIVVAGILGAVVGHFLK